MRAVLEALKSILNNLDMDIRMDNSIKRQKIQKSIYLCKIIGIDIGYHFGFYTTGVYSPELVEDCYELIDNDIPYKELNLEINNKLKIIKSIIKVPDNVDLAQWEWMELLTTTHYLRDNYSLDCVLQKMYKDNPKCVDFVENAEFVLQSNGLIN